MTAQRDFPSCCTGDVLIGFGKTSTGDHESQAGAYGMTDKSLAIEVVAYMRRAAQSGNAFLTCAINSDQTIANKVLRELGWKPSKWMTKRNHRNTKVRVWLWAVEDLPGLLPGYTQPSPNEILLGLGLDKYVIV